MPLAFLDVKKSIVGFITNSNVWNSLLSNPFSMGILISVCIMLILILSHDNTKSNTKNMTSFILYSSVFAIVVLALHDSVLLYNYKIKHDNTFEKKLISGNFNSNKSDSQFFDDTVKVNNETSVQYNTNMQNQMSGPNEDLLMPQPKVEFQS